MPKVCDLEQICLAAVFVHAMQLINGQRRKHFEYGENVQLPLVFRAVFTWVTGVFVGEYDSGFFVKVIPSCAVNFRFQHLQQLSEDAAHAPHVDSLPPEASDGKLMARKDQRKTNLAVTSLAQGDFWGTVEACDHKR